MSDEGPDLAALLRRLSDTPPEFLATPRSRRGPGVHVDAVVYDLLLDLGWPPPKAVSGEPFDGQIARRPPLPGGRTGARYASNRLQMVLVAAWLLGDPWFRDHGRLTPAVLQLLDRGVDELAVLVDASECVGDPDRREELVRVVLHALLLRPRGESEAEADDRRATLDSVERVRVIEKTRAAQARMREVREQMAAQAAAAAAAKVTRE